MFEGSHIFEEKQKEPSQEKMHDKTDAKRKEVCRIYNKKEDCPKAVLLARKKTYSAAGAGVSKTMTIS